VISISIHIDQTGFQEPRSAENALRGLFLKMSAKTANKCSELT